MSGVKKSVRFSKLKANMDSSFVNVRLQLEVVAQSIWSSQEFTITQQLVVTE